MGNIVRGRGVVLSVPCCFCALSFTSMHFRSFKQMHSALICLKMRFVKMNYLPHIYAINPLKSRMKIIIISLICS